MASANAETLKGAVDGVALETKLKADNVTGLTEDMFSDDALAFFDTKLTIDSATGEITATTEVNEGSFTAYGSSSNAREIGKALAATKDGALFDMLLTANGEQVGRTYDSLGNDAFLNAQNALIVNTITMTRAVKDQAQGIGGARVAEMADGTARIWATGIGTWGDVDYGNSSIDNDFYAGLVGAEVDVCPAAKLVSSSVPVRPNLTAGRMASSKATISTSVCTLRRISRTWLVSTSASRTRSRIVKVIAA